ncbi:sugar O-acyltransferase (sialic acid O-acetyltransferase NeuD family) [Thermonema lapsum]|uniref:Sugar O-acyltransferase (Sialic acid O-acetyltransferase NeuD family) n=1 Tax=Thermonema lapsum TaxID=28195 RepID=A0A846MR04_9BACT|nr:acetyltransferase [Thermonema lapsum]NIK73993.1 sugar O-acyltransferase (sialic acid O-acetyltransferase NeuD family) [Thermonema lapsum]
MRKQKRSKEKHLVIVGKGGHAAVIADAAALSGIYATITQMEIDAQLIEQHPEQAAQMITEWQARHAPCAWIVGIGDNYRRAHLMTQIEKIYAVEWATVCHPNSVVAASAHIDAGSFVAAMAVVGVRCRIGRGCIVNHHASLDHDSQMEAYSSLAPGAITGGQVHIGSRSAIGLGARLIHRITIGNDTVVGAGALVLTSLPAGVVAYGVPAQIMRTRKIDEPYL